MDYKTALSFLSKCDITGFASLSVIRCPDTGRFLMMESDKGFGFPCGKQDPGETAPEAAYRELQEETGIVSHLSYPLVYVTSMQNGSVMVDCYESEVPIEVPARPQDKREGRCVWKTQAEIREQKSPYQAFNVVLLEELYGSDSN